MTAPLFDLDEHGYPTDEWIAEFEKYQFKDFSEAGQWLLEELPKIGNQIGYCRITITDAVDRLDRKVKRIDFATGGWSGCEELIETAVRKMWIAQLHTKWERGGLFTFEVPVSYLKESS